MRLTWNDQTRQFDGHELVWGRVEFRAKRPLMLTPTGPTIMRPNSHDPGHALALLSEVMNIERISGDLPPPLWEPEPDTPPNAVF